MNIRTKRSPRNLKSRETVKNSKAFTLETKYGVLQILDLVKVGPE